MTMIILVFVRPPAQVVVMHDLGSRKTTTKVSPTTSLRGGEVAARLYMAVARVTAAAANYKITEQTARPSNMPAFGSGPLFVRSTYGVDELLWCSLSIPTVKSVTIFRFIYISLTAVCACPRRAGALGRATSVKEPSRSTWQVSGGR